MTVTLRRTLALVLVAALVALAGCGGPGASTVESPAGEEVSPTDNDAGAEPVNPPNGTTGEATEIEADGEQNGSNASGTEAGGANVTGGNETGGANDTGTNDTGTETAVPTA